MRKKEKHIVRRKVSLETRLGTLLGLALLAVCFCCAIAIIGVVTKH